VTPAVKAVSVGWNVSNQDGTSIDSLKCGELCLKPLYLVAWVVSFMKKLPILVIASLSINANNSGVRENSAILELKWSRIVTVLNKLV
jgi:hypothetical protein